MARVHVTGGYLNVEGMSGGYPDNSLPGEQPGIDNSLPIPSSTASGVWPPPVPAHPHSADPAWGQHAAAGHDLAQPWPSSAPDCAWRGTTYSHASDSSWRLASEARSDATADGMDPHPSHPIASGTYWCLVYLPGFGWKYVVIDPSLEINAEPPAPQPTPTPHK